MYVFKTSSPRSRANRRQVGEPWGTLRNPRTSRKRRRWIKRNILPLKMRINPTNLNLPSSRLIKDNIPSGILWPLESTLTPVIGSKRWSANLVGSIGGVKKEVVVVLDPLCPPGVVSTAGAVTAPPTSLTGTAPVPSAHWLPLAFSLSPKVQAYASVGLRYHVKSRSALFTVQTWAVQVGNCLFLIWPELSNHAANHKLKKKGKNCHT